MTPDAKSLFDFLVLLAFLTNLGVNLLTLFKLFRNDPQKREVTFPDEYADKDELEYLRDELRDLRGEVRFDRDDLLRAGDERAQKLHARIDALVEELPWKILKLLENQKP